MKNLILTVCFLLILATSCKKTENVEQNVISNQSISRSSSQSIEECRFAFAKALNAALISDTEFRNFIKGNLIFADSTNSEFLYLQHKDKIIHSNKTFASILKENTSANDLNQLGQDFFQNVTQIDPLLALSMPDETGCDISAWQSSNLLPDVAAVLTDPNGIYFKFNSAQLNGLGVNIDPTTPTIAVWKAEAYYLVNANGNTIDGAKLKDLLPSKPGATDRDGECDVLNDLAGIALMNYEVYGGQWFLISHNQLIEQYLDCLANEGSSQGGNPPITEPCDCERDCEVADEHLVRFRIKGWPVFQTIDNNFWENKYVFHADILAARDYANGSAIPFTAKCVTPTYRKRDLLEGCGGPFGGVCRGKWQTLDYRIWTDWDLEKFASPYYIDWAEVDGGTVTTTLSFPLSAEFKIANVTVKAGVTIGYSRVGDKIITLGNAPVFYCDPIRRNNSTGSIEFECD
jgi:hypothetical protein